jgi:hypothetical protein
VFPFDRTLEGATGLVWLGVLLVVGFLVTWLATDIGRVKRTPFVGLLALVTGATTAGYLWWSGAGTRFWTHQWAWGLLGMAAASVLMLMFARRLPHTAKPSGIVALIGWEGLVYGTAEGLLLSVLPVAMMSQISRSFGWTAGVGALVALVSSIALIAVHHLGYREFRGPMMRYPIVLCGVLTIAYLLTASPIAPVVGHVVFHVALVARGIELPPHAQRAESFEPGVARAA